MNWLDYLILGLLLFSTIRGYQRGLILTIASLVSYLAGWWAALLYSERATALVVATEDLYLPLFNQTKNFIASRSSDNGFSHLMEESFQDFWISLPLPDVTRNWLQPPETAVTLLDQAETWMLDQAAAALTQLIISLVVFVLIFLAVKYLVFFLGMLLHGIFKLPLLNLINRGGGILAGFVRGVLIIWVLLIVSTPLVATNPEGTLATAMEQSGLLIHFFWQPF